MVRIGIWENAGELSSALKDCLPVSPVLGRHPADFSEKLFDLLLVSPSARAWAGAGAIPCRTVLFPGAALPLSRLLAVQSAISYGTSPRDTLTLSSLEGRQICVALQREIVTLAGKTLEQQEFVLPFPPGEDPERFLCLTGARLLLTGAP